MVEGAHKIWKRPNTLLYSGDLARGAKQRNGYVKGSVAMAWLEEHSSEMVM